MKSKDFKKEKTFSEEDISFQSPNITAKERRDNLAAFGAYRQKTKGKISEEDKLRLRFLRLKFEINNFLKSQDSEHNFGFFLDLYMKSLELNGVSFAQEIHVKPSMISQILHNQKEPSKKLMMRLEIHSNYNFPAPIWYEVLAKQKSIELKNDDDLRKQEAANIQPKVALVI